MFKIFLQALSTPRVIFNAEKTDGGNAFTGKISFNRVTLNVGSGMSSDGFVAPYDGHYKMSFSAVGGWGKYGTFKTYVKVIKNGSFVFSIADYNNATSSHGNNISHDWIMELKKGDKLTFEVISMSYLRADSNVPVNFNGQLVLAES